MTIGFATDEIDLSVPTRRARLKWVVVVDSALPPGRAANAAICTAAATAQSVGGLLGTDAVDADGNNHPGLPWAGCSVLTADRETLRVIRAKAAARPDFFVADMPSAAQETRVYTEYLETIGGAAEADLAYYAVSLVGPRNPLDKIVGKLPLMA